MNGTNNTQYAPQDLAALQGLTYYDATIFGILIAVNIVFLILCVLFRNKEPIKSRGIVPPFALTLLLIANGTRLLIDFTPILAYPLVPVQLFSLGLAWGTVILAWIRYTMKQKIENLKKIQETTSSIRMHKWLQFGVSNWGLLIGFFVLGIPILIITGSIYISIFVTKTAGITITVMIIVFIVVEVFCSASLIIIDLALDVYKHGWFNGTYTERDPLNFKVDGVFLLICCFADALYLAFNQAGIGVYMTSGFSVTYVGVYAPTYFLEHIMRILLLLASGGSCLVVLTKRKVFSKRYPEVTQNQLLTSVLANTNCRADFRIFCEREFSVENFIAYESIEKLKTIQGQEKVDYGITIFQTFVQDDYGILQVNVSQSVRDELSQVLEMGVYNLSIDLSPMDEAFAKFELEVFNNLKDTFSRYVGKQSVSYQRARRLGVLKIFDTKSDDSTIVSVEATPVDVSTV